MPDTYSATWKRPCVWAVLLVLAAGLPLVVHHSYVLRILIMIGYFAVAAYGWDMIGGYGGQISLGQGAFFAVGAYSAAMGYLLLKVSPVVGGLIGTALSALLACGLGLVVFRLRGPYFTLSTLAVAEIVRILLLHFRHVTGGPEGLVIPYTGYNLVALQFATDRPYYYIVLALLTVAILLASRVRHSKLGYELAAIRNDEDAAESLGVNLMTSKVKAFVLSACLTALAGAFYVTYDHYIDPYSTCSSDVSTKILLIALVGGRRSMWGPLLGAALLIPLTELTNAYLGAVRAGASMLLYSVILLVVVLYAPDGIVRISGRIRRRNRPAGDKRSLEGGETVASA